MKFSKLLGRRKHGDTTNLAGGRAFHQSPKSELVSILLTATLEDTFYRGGNATADRVRELIKAMDDKSFVAKAAVYARTKAGMRSVSHLGAAELARYVKGVPWTKRFYQLVVRRPDDVLEILACHPAMAEEFEDRTLEKLFHIVIVHEENGVPVQLEDRFVNPGLISDFLDRDFAETTPNAVLVDSVPVDELEHTVEATLPSPDQQRLLGIDALEPCLTLRRRSWSGGRVATVVTLTYPASRYALYSRYHTNARGTLSQ